VCPAASLPDNYLHLKDWDSIHSIFLAYAASDELRFNASSGGVARTLLAGSVDRRQVDCGYALAKHPAFPWAEGSFWKPPVDLSNVPCSMYLPILANKNLKIEAPVDKLLLIGTPCQLMGAEALLKDKVQELYKIAFLCKQQKTLDFLRFVAKCLGVSQTEQSRVEISFRGQGWPGKLSFGTKRMSFEEVASLAFGRRLWAVPGCRLCTNPLGVNVDLTLADPWGIEKPGGLGKTLTVVWNQRGWDLLAENKDLLMIEPIDKSAAESSMDWAGVRRKQRMAAYYSGEKVPLRVKVGALGESIQTRLYEALLRSRRLSQLECKILAHLPDLRKIA
jgi:coenzyme F420-reducing hydrogenase beta subunit